MIVLKKHHSLLDDISLSGIFHENTKRRQFNLQSNVKKATGVQRGVQYKSYPRFQKTTLLKNFPQESVSIEEAIGKYRPIKSFNKMSLSSEALSKILFYSAGRIDQEKEANHVERVYPSVTGAYPLEVYPVILASKEIMPGIYHYNVKLHALESLAPGDFTSQIIRSTKNESIKKASAVILISAIFKRSEMTYGDRGYRYVLLNAGHLAQNIVLMITSIGLGCHIISEFLDDEVNMLLDLDGIDESIIHIVVLGGLERGLTDKVRGLFRS